MAAGNHPPEAKALKAVAATPSLKAKMSLPVMAVDPPDHLKAIVALPVVAVKSLVAVKPLALQ